jgi:hypothetical protein
VLLQAEARVDGLEVEPGVHVPRAANLWYTSGQFIMIPAAGGIRREKKPDLQSEVLADPSWIARYEAAAARALTW